jgi:hypothetical protein
MVRLTEGRPMKSKSNLPSERLPEAGLGVSKYADQLVIRIGKSFEVAARGRAAIISGTAIVVALVIYMLL